MVGEPDTVSRTVESIAILVHLPGLDDEEYRCAVPLTNSNGRFPIP